MIALFAGRLARADQLWPSRFRVGTIHGDRDVNSAGFRPTEILAQRVSALKPSRDRGNDRAHSPGARCWAGKHLRPVERRPETCRPIRALSLKPAGTRHDRGGETHYSTPAGMPALREAIAAAREQRVVARSTTRRTFW